MNKKKYGYSIVELLVTISMGTILLTALSQLIVQTFNSYRIGQQTLDEQFEARLAIIRITDDLRSAYVIKQYSGTQVDFCRYETADTSPTIGKYVSITLDTSAGSINRNESAIEEPNDPKACTKATINPNTKSNTFSQYIKNNDAKPIFTNAKNSSGVSIDTANSANFSNISMFDISISADVDPNGGAQEYKLSTTVQLRNKAPN